jgi:hypothetical protein
MKNASFHHVTLSLALATAVVVSGVSAQQAEAGLFRKIGGAVGKVIDRVSNIPVEIVKGTVKGAGKGLQKTFR